MAYKDFREFLNAVRDQGELLDIDRPVALEFEVGKALRKSAAVAGSALIFKNNGTRFPLVGGVYNSRSKALIAFQSSESNVLGRILDGLSKRIPPVLIHDAPVTESWRVTT